MLASKPAQSVTLIVVAVFGLAATSPETNHCATACGPCEGGPEIATGHLEAAEPGPGDNEGQPENDRCPGSTCLCHQDLSTSASSGLIDFDVAELVQDGRLRHCDLGVVEELLHIPKRAQ